MKFVRCMNIVCVAVVMLGLFSVHADDEKNKAELKRLNAKWEVVGKNGFQGWADIKKVMKDYPQEKTFVEAMVKSGKYPELVDATKANLAALHKQQDARLGTDINFLKNKMRKALQTAKALDMQVQRMEQAGQPVPPQFAMMFKSGTDYDNTSHRIEMLKLLAADKAKTNKDIVTILEQWKQVQAAALKFDSPEKAQTPPDLYQGKDKEALKAKVLEAWKALRPDDKIMGVRFLDQEWVKRKEERYNNVTGWYWINISSMELRIVVNEDDKIAGVYPVYLTIDHMDNNKMEIDTQAARSPQMKTRMLVKNYKP